MVKEIVEKQQQQQPVKKRTQNCLACGQPKSRYLGDGSSIHFFYQSANVKYFYCSTKVYQMYAAEGLANPRMPFADFAETPFFKREARQVMEERRKRKTMEQHPLVASVGSATSHSNKAQRVHTYILGSLVWQGNMSIVLPECFPYIRQRGWLTRWLGRVLSVFLLWGWRKRWAAEKGKWLPSCFLVLNVCIVIIVS